MQENAKKTRCFIGIPVESDIKDFLFKTVQQLKQKGTTNIRWVKVDNLHITLKFLGDILDEDIESIKDDLKTFSLNHQAFNLELSDINAFPSKKKPRVIWAGFSDPHNRFQYIQGKIENMMLEQGFPKEKQKAIPHITLARIKQTRSTIIGRSLFDVNFVDKRLFLCINKVVLFKSTLLPDGVVYTPLQEVNLLN